MTGVTLASFTLKGWDRCWLKPHNKVLPRIKCQSLTLLGYIQDGNACIRLKLAIFFHHSDDFKR